MHFLSLQWDRPGHEFVCRAAHAMFDSLRRACCTLSKLKHFAFASRLCQSERKLGWWAKEEPVHEVEEGCPEVSTAASKEDVKAADVEQPRTPPPWKQSNEEETVHKTQHQWQWKERSW